MSKQAITIGCVTTPPACELLRADGFIGAEIVNCRFGRETGVPQHLGIGEDLVPHISVRVRDIEASPLEGDRFGVDGNLGPDILLPEVARVSLATRRLRLLRLPLRLKG
jgi:hypothetical protein